MILQRKWETPSRNTIVFDSRVSNLTALQKAKILALAPFYDRYRDKYRFGLLPKELQIIYDDIIVSKDRKFLYVRNSKAACTTISQLIHAYSFGYYCAGEIHNCINLESGRKYFALYDALINARSTINFTFVRNPQERAISAFASVLLAKRYPYERHMKVLAARGYDAKGSVEKNLDVFLDYCDESNSLYAYETDRHWRLQVINTGISIVKYDYIGRVENFEVDIRNVFALSGDAQRIKKLAYLDVFNNSPNTPTLSRAQKKKIEKIYWDDFNQFGYW